MKQTHSKQCTYVVVVTVHSCEQIFRNLFATKTKMARERLTSELPIARTKITM